MIGGSAVNRQPDFLAAHLIAFRASQITVGRKIHVDPVHIVPGLENDNY